MGSTTLELTRNTHENMERFARAVCEELDEQPRTFKEHAGQTHRINYYLNNIVECSKKLIDLYEDKDGTKKEEINSLTGSGNNLYSNFYDRLRELREYHRRFPGLEAEIPEDAIYVDESVVPPFTGDEAWGQALDLHYLFEMFINLRAAPKTDYLTYLDNFFTFEDDEEWRGKEYRDYLKDLMYYLTDFIKRSQPFFEIEKTLKQIDEDYKAKLIKYNGKFSWKLENPPPEKVDTEPTKDKDKSRDRDRDRDRKDKRSKSSKKDKKAKKRKDRDEDKPREKERDEPKVKQEEDKPVYCEACKKQFAKATVYKAHLTGKKHKRAEALLTGKPLPPTPELEREIYFYEYRIHHLCTKVLSEQLSNTKVNIEKKQSKSWEEMVKEWEAELKAEQMAAVEKAAESEEEEETEIKMTKDNYPIGWDGKPIPYWLFKLHGLGVEYKCEICGNTSYWGRKAYEKHFQEWRHAHGMRCLGIPNSKHFHDITTINDAIQLWEKLKYEQQQESWKAEADEEFEDKEGNVFNRKTYEDLKRQNLL